MRVVKFSLKLLAIPILLMLLAVQWGLTFGDRIIFCVIDRK